MKLLPGTLLILFFAIAAPRAQEMNRMFVTGQATLLENEFIGSNVTDANGEICAGLIIKSDLGGFEYSSNNGIVKVDRKPGNDLLYLSASERVVEIYKTGYAPLKIILRENGVYLKPKQVYEISITGDKQIDAIPVNIITNPAGAEITINGTPRGSGQVHKLPPGKHTLKIEMSGFKPLEEEIEVTDAKTLFNFTLNKVKVQKVTVTSTPPGAQIFLNNALKPETTDAQFFEFPGEYSLRLLLTGHLEFTTTIRVEEGKPNEFSFSLQKNAVMLTVATTPSDARVLINKKDHDSTRRFELVPGRYQVEIIKEGFAPTEDIVELSLGNPVERSYTLRQLVGSLQATVKPIDAEVTLTKNSTEIRKWKGSEYIEELGVGSYKLTVKKSGFKTNETDIAIEEQKTANISVTLEEGNDASGEMVFVKGGTFQMGSNDGESDEKPVHSVTVSDFYIDKYEVTVKQYREFCNATGRSMLSAPNWGWQDDHPIVYVTWGDASAYAQWAGKRLPTEAEWEYAARGGNQSSGYKYAGSNNIDEVAWYSSNSGGKTNPVGRQKPNELGIYDMTGNVWEWCSDWYDENYYSKSPGINPQGPSSGTYRVLRGGSWDYIFAVNCRVAIRFRGAPGLRNGSGGFRCARNP